MVRKIRTRAIVDAQVVDGMKNKLVVDSEQQEHMGGVVDSGDRQRRRKTKTSRSSTWILVDDVNTRNKQEHHDRSYNKANLLKTKRYCQATIAFILELCVASDSFSRDKALSNAS